VTEEILETGRSIIDQPMMGRVVPELGQPQTRERFVYSYRIIYELQGEAIHVLGVIHGRRLLEHLDERFRALRYRLKKLGIE
jgi:plasmid stabilization system protein ParE